MTTSRAKPETLRLKAIAPALTVNDCAASLAWYRDVVGFHPKETWEHEGAVVGAELVAGSQTLMLVQDDWAKGKDRTKGVGVRLYLMTTQDVDELAEAIRSRGGRIEKGPMDAEWGARIFQLVDPDGFQITVSAPAV